MIIRDYQCLDCNREFEVTLESGAQGDPDCPYCDKVLDWVPGMFSVKTVKSRAVDMAQKIAEEDYGLTNMRDNSRAGDIAAITPAETTSAREERIKMEREIAEMAATEHLPPSNAKVTPQAFWGGGAPAPQAGAITAQALIASGKTGPEANVNPMKILHDGIKAGHIPRKERIIARWKPQQ